MENLYLKDTWINPSIVFMVNRTINEYDLESASLSICKSLKLLDENEIIRLSNMDKMHRNIEMGLHQKDEKFRNELKKGLIYARKTFIELNSLTPRDIISIKKDAFFINKICIRTEFDGLNFRKKNSYTSYARIANKLELYYREGLLDVKGIGDNMLKLHEDSIISMIKTWFKKMEEHGKYNANKYLRKMYDKYKRMELDLGYYRRFDQGSSFEIDSNIDGLVNKDTVVPNYNIGAVFVKLAKLGL